MRELKANLLGLIAGVLLGGGSLFWVWPYLEAWVHSVATPHEANAPEVLPAIVNPAPAGAATSNSKSTNSQPANFVAPSIAPPAPKPPDLPPKKQPGNPELAVPAAMPSVIRPGGMPASHGQIVQMPLPAIIYPPGARPAERRSGARAASSGTGFFVGEDGSLLTAAHVVPDCSRIQVTSPFFPPTAATIVATDKTNDIALLRAASGRPPAILPLGRPSPNSHALFTVGYPADNGKPTRVESWGTLENERMTMLAGMSGDSRQTVWLQNHAITHGFSGGAILDAVGGGAVGLVKAGVTGGFLGRMRGKPMTGVVTGPGAVMLTAFLAREAPSLILSPPREFGDRALDIARKATLHVLCWQR
jgi:S1-C subfamily serine protease